MRPPPSTVLAVVILLSVFLYFSHSRNTIVAAPAAVPCPVEQKPVYVPWKGYVNTDPGPPSTWNVPKPPPVVPTPPPIPNPESVVANIPSAPTTRVLPEFQIEPDLTVFRSRLCSYVQTAQPEFTRYLAEMGDGPNRMHRKQWEFAVIVEALEKMDKLGEGRRGLGFAVGQEPLARYFVKRGSRVTVSDMPLTGRRREEWASTGQHAGQLENTFRPGVVTLEEYKEKADFVPVDMNNIPKELLQGQYDFIWSCGSLEHVGVGQASLKFILKSLEALKVGGVAAHTTEFLLNGKQTQEEIGLNFFTEKEIRDWVTVIESLGHKVVPLEFAAGTKYDIDSLAAHRPINHIQLQDHHRVLRIHTSNSLIIIKGEPNGKSIPLDHELPQRQR